MYNEEWSVLFKVAMDTFSSCVSSQARGSAGPPDAAPAPGSTRELGGGARRKQTLV